MPADDSTAIRSSTFWSRPTIRRNRVRPHRLDANTTGLIVCARTRHFAGILQPQFERGEVEKVYLVHVAGHPAWDRQVCEAPIGEEPVEIGLREIRAEGGPACATEFTVRTRRDDGTTLLEARLLTGRTNQIRLALAAFGASRGGRSGLSSGPGGWRGPDVEAH